MHLGYVDETYTEDVYTFAVLLVDQATMQREALDIPHRFAIHGIDASGESSSRPSSARREP